jgi:predicted nucleic acid-binding protein
MIILDTNIVSEIAKGRPDKNVLGYFRQLEPQPITITCITVAELRHGIECLPEGKRKEQLDKDITVLLEDHYGGGLTLDFNSAAAYAYGVLGGRLKGEWIAISQSDAMIASIALVHEATLVTRNEKDFLNCGISIVNPF